MKNQIFISYSWKNESIVDEIDKSFMRDDMKLIRDKRNTEYKDSFKEFMKKIRETDYVLMVISDAYLKSKNCMYEVLEVLKDENFKKRIFPIVLSDAKIYSPAARLDYLAYWKSEYDNLKKEISKYSPDEVISVTEDLKIIRNINGSITDFISIVSDLKNIPFEKLKQNEYIDIKQKLRFRIKTKSKIRYDVLKQEDVSHAGAKRYSAQLLIDSKYNKEEIKRVIEEVTESLKNSNYYRNEKFKQHFNKRTTDVVWLFIANRLSDVDNANWICRTSWINPSLDENMKPIELEGDDSIGEIKIEWNDKYEEIAEFYDDFLTTKDSFLSVIDSLLSRNQDIIKPLIDKFNSSIRRKDNFKNVIEYINANQEKIDTINNEANNILMPPQDCKSLDELTQSYFAISHNLFLYYSSKGLDTWKEQNRISLMKQDVNRLQELEGKILIERKDI